MPVEIGKSTYVPVDDRFTLREEFDALLSKAAQIEDPFEQSFFLLVHLPYLQPFADVNKRTSRIASLIPLLKADLIPMSFLAIDDRSYVRGVLGVYELNDVSLLREAYVNGYIASAEALPLRATSHHLPRKERRGVPPLHQVGDPALRTGVADLRAQPGAAADGRRRHPAAGPG